MRRLSVVPAWLVVGVGVLAPLGALVWIARVGVPGSVPSTVPLSRRLVRAGSRTVVQAGVSTVATVAVGLPVAAVLAARRFPGAGVLRALIAMPFVMPSVVVGAATLAWLGPNGRSGIHIEPGSTASIAMIVFAHVAYELVVVVEPAIAAFRRVPIGSVDAAKTLGVGPLRRFGSVVWPVIGPTVLRSAALVFLLTASSFGVVLILGGLRWGTLDTEIWYLGTQVLDLRGASGLALVQVAVVIPVSLFVIGARHTTVEAGALRPPVSIGCRRPGGPLAVAAVVGLLVVAPMASLSSRLGLVSSAQLGRLWRGDVPGVPAVGGAALRSLGLAVAVGLVCIVAAVGVGVARRAGGGRTIDAVLLLPVGVSATAIGLGIVAMGLLGVLDLRGSTAGLFVVQAASALPFAATGAVAALRSVPASLDEVAATLGSDRWGRVRRVAVPIAAPAVAGAGALAAAVALGEFGASVFVASGSAPTLPTLVGRLLTRQSPDAAAAGVLIAAILGLIAAGFVVLAALATGRSGSRRSRRAKRGPESGPFP